MNNTQIIKEILQKKDVNNVDYLILKLDNGGAIYAFPWKVGKEKWAKMNWLEEGKAYSFITEKGNNENDLLVDFEIETEKQPSESN